MRNFLNCCFSVALYSVRTERVEVILLLRKGEFEEGCSLFKIQILHCQQEGTPHSQTSPLCKVALPHREFFKFFTSHSFKKVKGAGGTQVKFFLTIYFIQPHIVKIFSFWHVSTVKQLLMGFYILFCTFFLSFLIFFLKSGMYFTLNSTSQCGPATFQVSHMWLVATTLACAALSLGKLKKKKNLVCTEQEFERNPSNNQQRIPTPQQRT